MLKYFNYKGGNVLNQLKDELNIKVVSTLGKTYYTTINDVEFEMIDYGFVKDDTNLIFAELVEVK